MILTESEVIARNSKCARASIFCSKRSRPRRRDASGFARLRTALEVRIGNRSAFEVGIRSPLVVDRQRAARRNDALHREDSFEDMLGLLSPGSYWFGERESI